VVDGPLACVEILGHSVVERMVDRFLGADVEAISVLVDSALCLPAFRRALPNVSVRVVDDVWVAATETLQDFSQRGIDYAFIAEESAYTECDLIDMVWFHRGTRRAITRAFDRKGNLDFWIADCGKIKDTGFSIVHLKREGPDAPSYFISEYVNRLTDARDIRQLVMDIFGGRCESRPSGQEIRPGVWVDEGAQIHKRARIVAPAYIGRYSRVWEDTLVTRCSNIECMCYIDYGTVIEDSSVLKNSYVGIWLDVSHAVVGGNKLMNLERNVLLEISDPSLIREHEAVSKAAERSSAASSALPVFAFPK
jgi:hypothetical protein